MKRIIGTVRPIAGNVGEGETVRYGEGGIKRTARRMAERFRAKGMDECEVVWLVHNKTRVHLGKIVPWKLSTVNFGGAANAN